MPGSAQFVHFSLCTGFGNYLSCAGITWIEVGVKNALGVARPRHTNWLLASFLTPHCLPS
jgi:hypothetical protein